MKIQKKKLGGRGVRGRGLGVGRGQVGGVRVDVIEELKFLGKFTKKNSGGGGGSVLWGFRLGVRMDVNEEMKFL